MEIKPISLRKANEFVKENHRHNLPTAGGKFAISCVQDGKLIGVAICGRPINRCLDDDNTLEVYRVATDGTRNSTSFLYNRCKRIGQLMGYERIITYTLQSESGSSLRGIGAKQMSNFKGRQWKVHQNGVRNFQSVFNENKIRWEL